MRTIARRRTQTPAVNTVVRGRQRLQGWERLSHGLYMTKAPPRHFIDELRAWSLVLPATAAFTHLTAAELKGWWLPDAPPHPVFAAMRRGDPRPRRSGLYVCRHPNSYPMTITTDGLKVTTAAETLLACARDLGTLDVVIMADSALRSGGVTMIELKIAASQRRRGAPRLRQVIPLLDPRSESPWESVLRVLHRAADIAVEPQHVIIDEYGQFLARADLWIKGTRRIHEYDGAVHREAEVHHRDLKRERNLIMSDWQRFGFTSAHILNEGAAIIRSVDDLLRRPWDSRRLQAWEELLNESMFRRTGRARALRKWSRAL
jgi:very-short-patch-repair endonuclease